MAQMITEGIKVSSSAFYQKQYSDPSEGQYAFGYRILIENLSPYPVRLLQRRLNIFDSLDEYREAEGKGVVGLQPLIEPGEEFQYESQFTLISDMGTLKGEYLFENLKTGLMQKVFIPGMQLVAPFKNN
jgi:ApaG protein